MVGHTKAPSSAFCIATYMNSSQLQDQGTPSNRVVIMLDVQVTAAAAAPPVFVPLVYTVSAAEADYTASVSA